MFKWLQLRWRIPLGSSHMWHQCGKGTLEQQYSKWSRGTEKKEMRRRLPHSLAQLTSNWSAPVSTRAKGVTTLLPGFNHLNSKRLTVSGAKAAVSPMLNTPLFRTRLPQKQSHKDIHPVNLLSQYMLRACYKVSMSHLSRQKKNTLTDRTGNY